MPKKLVLIIVAMIGLISIAQSQKPKDPCIKLCNPDFESPALSPGDQEHLPAKKVPCWRTTAADNTIEIWAEDGSLPDAHSGNQYAELNSNDIGDLYQVFNGIAGEIVSVSFAHRGRIGNGPSGLPFNNNMQVSIGPEGGPYTVISNYTAITSAWTIHSFNYTLPAGSGSYRISFATILNAAKDAVGGNFLDSITVSCAKEVQQPQLCCDSMNTSVTLDGNVLTLNGGTIPLQEVEVSVMDYHVEYNNPLCKPDDMGLFGSLSTTTINLATLDLDAASNPSQSLTWKPGVAAVLNNQNINLDITPPLVVNLECCKVKFWYCLKVTFKDINCNVCEKIVCVDSTSDEGGCSCGSRKSDEISVAISDLTNTVTKKYKCGDIINNVKPNGSASLVFDFPDYTCIGENCNATYSWKIKCPPGGTVCRSGTGNIINTTGFSTQGSYVVSMYSYCGGKICDSCQLFINVRQDSLCDCKGWGNDSLTYSGGGITGKFSCNNGSPISVMAGPSYTFTSQTYFCTPSSLDCQATYRWKVDGMPAAGTLANPFTTTFTSGTHVVMVTPYCNGKPCPPCKFIVIAKNDSCQCGEKKWISNSTIQYTDYATNLGQGKKIECFARTIAATVPVGSSMTYSAAAYLCKPGCSATYNWKIINVSTNGVVNSGMSPSLPIIFNAPIQGSYKFIVYAKCGGNLCDSCGFNFNTKQKTDQGCCPGKWENMRYSDPGGTKYDLQCGKVHNVKCKIPYGLAPSYKCKGDSLCKGKITYSVSPSGANITGNVFTATANGLYTITIKGWCGDSVCEKCVFYFKVTGCDSSCNCGKWKSDSIKMTYSAIQPCPPGRILKCGGNYTNFRPASNVNFAFPAYLCNPTSCNATYTWTINGPGGTQTGTSNVINNITLSPGSYNIVMVPKCGTVQCTPCKISFIVKPNVTVCDSLQNTTYTNGPTFISTLSSPQLIDFSTNDNGTPISADGSDRYITCWNRNGIAFDNFFTYWGNQYIYQNPIIINLPPGAYTKSGFDFVRFPWASVGTVTIKVYSGICIYTYNRTNISSGYFGINVPSGIDKIEISTTPPTAATSSPPNQLERIKIDNFVFD